MDEGSKLNSLCVATPHSCVCSVKCTLCNALLLGWNALLMLHRTEECNAQWGPGEGQVLIGCRLNGSALQKILHNLDVGRFCCTAGSQKSCYIHYFFLCQGCNISYKCTIVGVVESVGHICPHTTVGMFPLCMFLIPTPALFKNETKKKKNTHTHTIKNMRQTSDWTLAHFGAISLLAARPLSESQVITRGVLKRLFMMECHFVRLLLFVTDCQEGRLPPCDIPDNPDQLSPACNRKQTSKKCICRREMSLNSDVKGRSLVRK